MIYGASVVARWPSRAQWGVPPRKLAGISCVHGVLQCGETNRLAQCALSSRAPLQLPCTAVHSRVGSTTFGLLLVDRTAPRQPWQGLLEHYARACTAPRCQVCVIRIWLRVPHSERLKRISERLKRVWPCLQPKGATMQISQSLAHTCWTRLSKPRPCRVRDPVVAWQSVAKIWRYLSWSSDDTRGACARAQEHADFKLHSSCSRA